MEIKKAEFLTTVADKNKLITNLKNEFAFVGRSNVGKSSLINALTKNSKLAKTSSVPGKTKLINYFSMNGGDFHIVDLPGYGYHKASKEDEQRWITLLENYFIKSKNLRCVFVLVDIRHDVSELDEMMIEFLVYHRLPFKVVLTKSDKLKRNEQVKQIDTISTQLGIPRANLVVISSQYKLGLGGILETIEKYSQK
ncbi:MAG: YihA family ribosome biogenesis GTP-binding protein [Clostridiales bacterium]|nr:YihA family ribosome biogenesis GTP-binding protein [Candidatus Apopatousia equi]